MKKLSSKQTGFTIVELLIVIVVIAILATISVVAYNGIQARARQSKIANDISQLTQAIVSARISANTSLYGLTGFLYTASACTSLPSGTDLSTLPSTHDCWVRYNTVLNNISDASGINVRGIKDPWNRPYFIYEVEGTGSWPEYPCKEDEIAVYRHPFVTGWTTTNMTYIDRYSPPPGC